jgi:tRNA(fMet)-specific endonuclease VapC
MSDTRGYMLDTETCAAILRRADAVVMERLARVAVSDVCISAVTLSELMYGAEVSRRTAQERAALDVFLRHIAVLEYPQAAAEEYGRLRMILELCEARLDPHELLAAAHARCLGMTLVSAKARGIAQVHRMVVESWAHGGI